jgi:hypothetical protein
MKETIVKIAVIIAVVTVLCSPAACTMHRVTAVKEAIAHGADPIAAKCAMEFADSSQVCLNYVPKQMQQVTLPPATITYRVNPD